MTKSTRCSCRGWESDLQNPGLGTQLPMTQGIWWHLLASGRPPHAHHILSQKPNTHPCKYLSFFCVAFVCICAHAHTQRNTAHRTSLKLFKRRYQIENTLPTEPRLCLFVRIYVTFNIHRVSCRQSHHGCPGRLLSPCGKALHPALAVSCFILEDLLHKTRCRHQLPSPSCCCSWRPGTGLTFTSLT